MASVRIDVARLISAGIRESPKEVSGMLHSDCGGMPSRTGSGKVRHGWIVASACPIRIALRWGTFHEDDQRIRRETGLA